MSYIVWFILVTAEPEALVQGITIGIPMVILMLGFLFAPPMYVVTPILIYVSLLMLRGGFFVGIDESLISKVLILGTVAEITSFLVLLGYIYSGVLTGRRERTTLKARETRAASVPK